MKFIKQIIAIAVICYPAMASAQLRIKITNVSSLKGNLFVGAFKSASDFNQKKEYKGLMKKADSSQVDLVMNGLAPGWYMIAVYHDLNSNGVLDNNFFHIPVEPYGFSLNQMGLMGPDFEKSKFYYDGSDVFLEIKLKQ